jgi:hypothetical protein
MERSNSLTVCGFDLAAGAGAAGPVGAVVFSAVAVPVIGASFEKLETASRKTGSIASEVASRGSDEDES